MIELGEMISLVLTWPTIVAGIGVILHWGPKAWEAYHIPAPYRTDVQWLILGVSVGFLGGVLDNTYWGVAWTAEFMEWKSAEKLFATGAMANIPFRQGAGTYAAYCHMRSYYLANQNSNKKLLSMILLSLVAGFAYVAIISYLRSG